MDIALAAGVRRRVVALRLVRVALLGAEQVGMGIAAALRQRLARRTRCRIGCFAKRCGVCRAHDSDSTVVAVWVHKPSRLQAFCRCTHMAARAWSGLPAAMAS